MKENRKGYWDVIDVVIPKVRGEQGETRDCHLASVGVEQPHTDVWYVTKGHAKVFLSEISQD